MTKNQPINAFKMEDALFTKIMVEIQGGVIVNITDLPKDQYEYFLNLTNQIRIAYIALSESEKK